MKIAMILAAGRGERLRPLTDTVPKPLCLVQGKPLISHHVLKLAEAGFERVVINHAHLGGQIRHALGNGKRFGIEICYSPEPPGGLETAGGIVNALPLLGERPFLAINSDIYTDFDFATMQASPALANLILVKQPTYRPKADFGICNNEVTNHNRLYTYAGIAYYDPIIFQKLKPGRFSLTPLLRQLIDNKQVTGLVYEGEWVDIGSVERLGWVNEQPARSANPKR